MPPLDQFQKFDIRVGTVISARPHRGARNPALQLQIDFGEMGVKQSSAQITRRYTSEDLISRQVVAVVNFPPRRIAGFRSDVLVLGAIQPGGDVVLLTPDGNVPAGTRIG
ncbi:MAG: tRNA-binding protein [Gemmatimonadota bacterium]|nr:MAG: tRNA-binding protein [Gemmatimonadota bacterium]